MRDGLRFVVFAAAGLLSAGQADAALVKALADNAGTPQLLTFDTATPGTLVGGPVTVTGLTGGDALVDIDFRPVDSALIGLGYNSATGAGRVYFIDPTTGLATSINTVTFATGLARIIADFNPTANALRITTSGPTSNNLRIPTGGTGALTTDTDLNPANPGMRASAYSRNLAGGGTSGATTLYLLDAANLYNQGSVDFFTGSGTSPNSGTLTTVAAHSGIPGTIVGLDIFNGPGSAASSPGVAYVTNSVGGFRTLNLSTGATTSVGTIGGTYTSIRAIAVPEPGSLALAGMVVGGMVLARRRRAAVV